MAAANGARRLAHVDDAEIVEFDEERDEEEVIYALQQRSTSASDASESATIQFVIDDRLHTRTDVERDALRRRRRTRVDAVAAEGSLVDTAETRSTTTDGGGSGGGRLRRGVDEVARDDVPRATRAGDAPSTVRGLARRDGYETRSSVDDWNNNNYRRVQVSAVDLKWC